MTKIAIYKNFGKQLYIFEHLDDSLFHFHQLSFLTYIGVSFNKNDIKKNNKYNRKSARYIS